ncbi:minor tail protein [Arthrobacter phage Berka]|nr:minor tail protein [Arthrobacter phage Berka]
MAITAPYELGALETVKHTHRQDFYAEVTLPSGVVRLNVSDAELTLSEDYSPRASASLSCANSLTAAQLSELDPRDKLAVSLYAGYAAPGLAPDVQLLQELQVSHRGVQQPGDALELLADSEEIRAIECLWLQAEQTKSFAGLVEALEWLIGYAVAPAVPVLQAAVGKLYRPDLVSAVVLEPGLALWDVAHSLAASADLMLYVDTQGTWRLERPATKYGETAAYLTLGPDTPVTNMDEILSRDGYYDAAVIVYTWKSGGNDVSLRGTWAPPAGALGAGAGCRTFKTERPGPITQSAANEAARLAIKNLSTRGASYTVDATAHYWLRPGMSVQLTRYDGTVERHICKTVRFNLAAGSMTVTTREPNNLGDI